MCHLKSTLHVRQCASGHTHPAAAVPTCYPVALVLDVDALVLRHCPVHQHAAALHTAGVRARAKNQTRLLCFSAKLRYYSPASAPYRAAR